MYDKALAKEILQQVHHAAELILKRFETIKTVNDFTNSALSDKFLMVCHSPRRRRIQKCYSVTGLFGQAGQ